MKTEENKRKQRREQEEQIYVKQFTFMIDDVQLTLFTVDEKNDLVYESKVVSKDALKLNS